MAQCFCKVMYPTNALHIAGKVSRNVHNFGNPFLEPSHSLFVIHGEKSCVWSCSCSLQVRKLSKLLTMHTAVSSVTFFLFLSFVHTPVDSKTQTLLFTSMLTFFFACLHLAQKCVSCASGRGVIYGRVGDVQSVKKP